MWGYVNIIKWVGYIVLIVIFLCFIAFLIGMVVGAQAEHKMFKHDEESGKE